MSTAPFTKWNDLSELDRERVVMMVPLLDEFYAGVELFQPVLPADPKLNRPAHRFFRNMVLQYLHALYIEGNNGILPVMDSIGFKPLADQTRAALAQDIGQMSVGSVINKWRNSGIAHLTLRAHHLVEGVEHAELLKAEHSEKLLDYITMLALMTAELRKLVRACYPEAAEINRRPDEPLDNGA